MKNLLTPLPGHGWQSSLCVLLEDNTTFLNSIILDMFHSTYMAMVVITFISFPVSYLSLFQTAFHQFFEEMLASLNIYKEIGEKLYKKQVISLMYSKHDIIFRLTCTKVMLLI